MEHPRWLSWTFMAFQWFPNVRHWTFPGKNRDRIFAICQMAQVWSKNLVRINLDRNLLSNPSISHMISIKNGDSCWFCYHWHSISYNISTSIIPFFIADMLLITHDIPQMASQVWVWPGSCPTWFSWARTTLRWESWRWASTFATQIEASDRSLRFSGDH